MDGFKGYFTRGSRKAPKLARGYRCGLEGLAGRADKISQRRNVRTVSADSPGVHGKTQAFRQIQIQTCIVELGQAESRRRQNTIYARRVDRPRRTVTLPGPARQLVKLLPIAFVPGGHLLFRGPLFSLLNLATTYH